MTDIRYTKDSIVDEDVRSKVERAIRSYYTTCFAVGIATVIATGILSIVLKNWVFIAFGGCMCVFLAMVISDRLYKVKNRYIYVTHGTCSEEEKNWYRRQTRNYVFVLGDAEDGRIVKIPSSVRHKFNVKGKYILVFFSNTEQVDQGQSIPTDFITTI